MSNVNHYPRMTELARSFPTLSDAPLDPFDPDKLDEWACSAGPSHGATIAARFVLAVWSGRSALICNRRILTDDLDYTFDAVTPWRCGIFDVVDALGTWDSRHRQAFNAWAKDPWWP